MPRTPCAQLPDINFCTVCVRINRDVAVGCPYSSRVGQVEFMETTRPVPLENVPKFEQYPLIEITKIINPRRPTEYKRTIDPDAVIVETIEVPIKNEPMRLHVKTVATRPMPITKVEKPPVTQQKVIKVKKSGQEVLAAPSTSKTGIPVAKEPAKSDVRTMTTKPVPVIKTEKPPVPQQKVLLMSLKNKSEIKINEQQINKK
ncbi:MAG: hypothetical protein WC974_06090 [Thermoplasmata archaeon]